MDFTIKRGDPKELIFYCPGNLSTYKIIFVVKANKVLTSNRLIQKKNTAAGGSGSELIAEVSGNETKITVKLEAADTQDFTALKYDYDITAQPADDSTDPETIEGGIINIDQDVQTPYDGFDLPVSATRFLQVDASNGLVGDLIQITTDDNGDRVFSFITIEELKTQLGI